MKSYAASYIDSSLRYGRPCTPPYSAGSGHTVPTLADECTLETPLSLSEIAEIQLELEEALMTPTYLRLPVPAVRVLTRELWRYARLNGIPHDEARFLYEILRLLRFKKRAEYRLVLYCAKQCMGHNWEELPGREPFGIAAHEIGMALIAYFEMHGLYEGDLLPWCFSGYLDGDLMLVRDVEISESLVDQTKQKK